MNKVEFTTNRGRVERMHPKLAELLARKGKGTYQTAVVSAAPLNTAMRAHIPPSIETDPEPAPVLNNPHTGELRDPRDVASDPGAVLAVEPGAPLVAAPIDLASMSVEELREHAKKQGVPVHHRAGAATILKALQDGAGE